MIGNTPGTGGYGISEDARFQEALNDFRRARQRAAVSQVLSRINGRSLELLSFHEVSEQLQETGRYEAGLQEIPLNAIVGSVGRTQDFDRDFLPLRQSDAERWARVKVASEELVELPPIDVYKIGDAYFVADGNHRVSIARQRGMENISAMVLEIKTLGSLPADATPEDVIMGAEEADFLAYTQLDKVRPEADIHLSCPGCFQKLVDHIALHRCFVEANEATLCRTVPEAASYWYDEAYRPLVDTIRERGLLRDFPGWQEADLYLWITENQEKLREALGWSVRPTAVVSNLADEIGRGSWTLHLRRIKGVLKSPGLGRQRADPWMQDHYLARYSRYLFTDILVPLILDAELNPGEPAALAQALAVAHGEGGNRPENGESAQIFGLALLEEDTPIDEEMVRATQAAFAHHCQENGVTGVLAIESGQISALIAERAVLADLIVLDEQFLAAVSNHESGARELFQALRQVHRPVLLARQQPAPLARLLLVMKGDEELDPALFSAAYLAERWSSRLSLVGVRTNGRAAPSKAQRYLELHEVEAPYLGVDELTPATILATAEAQGSDLVIVKWPVGGLARGRGLAEILELAAAASPAILFCP